MPVPVALLRRRLIGQGIPQTALRYRRQTTMQHMAPLAKTTGHDPARQRLATVPVTTASMNAPPAENSSSHCWSRSESRDAVAAKNSTGCQASLVIVRSRSALNSLYFIRIDVIHHLQLRSNSVSPSRRDDFRCRRYRCSLPRQHRFRVDEQAGTSRDRHRGHLPACRLPPRFPHRHSLPE